ncbi:outer membrane beta-barrel protein [Telluribacter sp.]|jgi:outer membrane receptor protein involved in Fe transport|uniref:outer membrane beta-barrel protein n=1 Tax=Telluribacter sp. TaxID=1978767 RepID=UPI002E12B1F6|nr:outer membrane beta-barrel protein [Telluribacter sp.]
MKILLLFLLLVIEQIAFAQSPVVQGRITDEQSSGLPAATVLLLQISDSSLVTSTLTDTSGQFSLITSEKRDYLLKVSFVGYTTYFKNLSISSTSDTLHVGTIVLQPDAIQLAEVAVKGQLEAIVVKKDTVEYNAGSYGTRANANVEQLLKKLPGVEVERDGSIRVQGEEVTRIFVDGKEFFGGDLEMATRNLPADAIDKVQVIDGKSEEAQFSGIEDGQREKVINLQLKKDRRNMGFGKAMAGVGTSGRYMAQGNYNRFGNGNQLAIVARSNNVNNQGLSADGMGGGGTGGISTTHSGGATFSRQLSRITRIHGSYRLNYTNATMLTDLTRQNFLPGGTADYFENSRQQHTTGRHNATAGLEHKGARNNVRLNTTLSLSNSDHYNRSSRQSFSVADTLVNAGERTANTRNQNLNFNANLFYGHRFRKTGRLFTVSNQVSAYQAAALGRSESFTRFNDGDEELVHQRNEQENSNLNFSSRFAYTEPISKKQYLQASYNITNRASESDLAVYDIQNETLLFNTEQSNRFSTGFLYQQLGLSYRLAGEKFTFSMGTTMQQSVLTRRILSEGDLVKRSFQNILPEARVNVRLNKTSRISLNYTTSVREPTINQLQPVVSRYDPLNLYIGNPELRPEYSHRGRLAYNTFIRKSGLFLSGLVNYTYTTNPIVAAVTIDDRQVRTTQYINVPQSYQGGVSLTLGVPVKKYHSRLNLGPYFRQGKSLNLLNGVMGAINQQSFGGNMGYSFTYDDYIDLSLRARLSATSSEYELNSNQGQYFVNTAYMSDVTLHFLNYFDFTAEFDYSKFRNANTGFDRAVPILNFGLSRSILKDSKGELRLSAINALNRDTGVTQTATLNYVEQVSRNTLGNYYMLSFIYNFKKRPSE